MKSKIKKQGEEYGKRLRLSQQEVDVILQRRAGTLDNINNNSASDIEISDKIFSLKPNNKVIQSVVDWQLNHFKPRTAKTKQRNEIRGSTSKIYAQKGTGGARHSSRKAPLFVGGGIAHGPKGAVYKVKKMNKKVRKLGLLHLLSMKNQDNSLFVIEYVSPKYVEE